MNKPIFCVAAPKIVVILLMVCGFTLPANASLMLTGGSNQTTIPGNNNYQGNLKGLGLTDYVQGGLQATASGTVIFYYHGQESGWDNSFLANGSTLVTETSGGTSPWNAAGTVIGSISVTSGQALNLAFDSSGGAFHSIGTPEFGIFGSGNLAGGSFSIFANDGRIYFGHDDDGAGPDDNHDDIIISARFVPEPASLMTWSVMAIGCVGFRRRRKT